jgi:hypothetical protein
MTNFHNLKCIFNNEQKAVRCPPEATKQISIKGEKAHSKKTTFTCEKVVFRLESTVFSFSIRIALERYL